MGDTVKARCLKLCIMAASVKLKVTHYSCFGDLDWFSRSLELVPKVIMNVSGLSICFFWFLFTFSFFIALFLRGDGIQVQ